VIAVPNLSLVLTMDLYTWSLLLGGVGLGAMAVSGLGHHGHAGHQHGGARGHAHHTGGARGSGHGPAHSGIAHSASAAAARTLLAVTSPRLVFSLLLGFGAAGSLLRPLLGGPLLLAAAIAGGILFERGLVTPLWNVSMRFASEPAQTLESAVTDEATAVTSFDANGQGIVSLEVDGQVVQILATLQTNDRLLAGPRVRAGQRVRIEDVNADKNCCTVSLL
jgi:hypothetical protein